jgi:hypothetical protein
LLFSSEVYMQDNMWKTYINLTNYENIDNVAK